jgi:hypothetical protein
VLPKIVQADGARLVDEKAQDSLSERRVADALTFLRAHPGVNEVLQSSIGSDHADRSVAGPYEVAGGADEVLEYLGQGQAARDRDDRLQQSVDPALVLHELVGTVDQLAEQRVQA